VGFRFPAAAQLAANKPPVILCRGRRHPCVPRASSLPTSTEETRVSGPGGCRWPSDPTRPGVGMERTIEARTSTSLFRDLDAEPLHARVNHIPKLVFFHHLIY
jgi:hypothetical protein